MAGKREFKKSEAYLNREGGKGKVRKPLPEHGTVARYCHRIFPCHCDKCKEARNLKAKQGRLKKKQYNLPTFSAPAGLTGSRDYFEEQGFTLEDIRKARSAN